MMDNYIDYNPNIRLDYNTHNIKNDAKYITNMQYINTAYYNVEEIVIDDSYSDHAMIRSLLRDYTLNNIIDNVNINDEKFNHFVYLLNNTKDNKGVIMTKSIRTQKNLDYYNTNLFTSLSQYLDTHADTYHLDFEYGKLNQLFMVPIISDDIFENILQWACYDHNKKIEYYYTDTILYNPYDFPSITKSSRTKSYVVANPNIKRGNVYYYNSDNVYSFINGNKYGFHINAKNTPIISLSLKY